MANTETAAVFLFAEKTSTMAKKDFKHLTVEQAIVRCGELLIEKANIPLLLADKLNRKEQIALARNLSSPNSEEYMLYAKGAANGELDTAIKLSNLVGNPKAKDAFKNLNEERRRQAINKKLHENFGLGEDI